MAISWQHFRGKTKSNKKTSRKSDKTRKQRKKIRGQHKNKYQQFSKC